MAKVVFKIFKNNSIGLLVCITEMAFSLFSMIVILDLIIIIIQIIITHEFTAIALLCIDISKLR